jgi:hypothetical protein
MKRLWKWLRRPVESDPDAVADAEDEAAELVDDDGEPLSWRDEGWDGPARPPNDPAFEEARENRRDPEVVMFTANMEPGFLRVVTPDGRLVVEFGGDGTVTVGDLDHPELVAALREAFTPLVPTLGRPCWCGGQDDVWHNCPVHGGALSRELPMQYHWKRLHEAFDRKILR